MSDNVLYQAWFAQLREVECGRGRMTLAAPSRFITTYVTTHFKGKLLAMLSIADASLIDLEITATG